MIADLLQVTVKGCTLLVSVNRIVSGIYIDYESSFVSASKQGVGASAKRIFEGLQHHSGCKYVVLKTAECGLACAIFMLFAQG